MAIRGSKRKLAHAPWLVVRRLQDLGTRGHRRLVECVDIIHAQVRDVAVIAELAGSGYSWTSAEHDGDLARRTEPPVARLHVIDLAAENVPVPRADRSRS